MKAAYPVVLSQGNTHILVYVPDFNINTQGVDCADAIEMARDAIGIMGIDMEDENEALPAPSLLSNFAAGNVNEIVTLVDVDFSAYRRRNDMKTVRRNVSLPSWLNVEAEKAGVNVSAILQSALKEALNIHEDRPAYNTRGSE